MGKITRTDKFDQLRKNAQEISGQNQVSFVELFPNDFVSQYTDFDDLQQMADAAGIEEEEDLLKPEWSDFVATHSQFASWEEMYETASAEWIKRKLIRGV